MPISLMRQPTSDNPASISDWAEENLRTPYPADSNRFSSDSRILGSSSTTAIIFFPLFTAHPFPGAARMGDGNLKLFRHAHEIGERSGSHLLHHIPSMNLKHHLADAQLGRSLLVEEPADHERQHVPLPRRQRGVSLAQHRHLGALEARLAVLSQPGS